MKITIATILLSLLLCQNIKAFQHSMIFGVRVGVGVGVDKLRVDLTKTKLAATESDSAIQVMVNGLPGPMAVEAAKVSLR